MIDAEKRAMLDQAKAEIEEVLPGMWWGLYNGCVKEGFTELQAIDLVKAFIRKPSEG